MKNCHCTGICRSVPLLLACVFVLALTACGCAQEPQSQPELILRYADNQPDDYPTTQAAYYFAELVAQQTEGRVKIKVYGDGVLGDELSIQEQMQFGGVDFSRLSLATLAQMEPSMAVLLLPYLYRDAQHMWYVLDGEIGSEFQEKIEPYNLIGLSWFDAGVRNLYTTEPVTALEDLRGRRLRVQESDMMSRMVSLWGATPEKIPYDGVYSALLQGKIDGAENNFSSYAAMDHNEAAPYVLLTEHCRIPEMQIISAAAMAKLEALDPGYPHIVRQCARESARRERELWEQYQGEAEAAVRREGCTVTELSPEEKEKFRQSLAPIYEDMSAYQDTIRWIRNYS